MIERENMYECWNPRCSRYAGGGAVLSSGDVFEFQDLKRCETCGREVQVRQGMYVPDWLWMIPLVVGMVLALVIVLDR